MSGLSRPPCQVPHSRGMCSRLPLLTHVPYAQQPTHGAGPTSESASRAVHATVHVPPLQCFLNQYRDDPSIASRVPYSHAVRAPARARCTRHLMRTMPTSSHTTCTTPLVFTHLARRTASVTVQATSSSAVYSPRHAPYAQADAPRLCAPSPVSCMHRLYTLPGLGLLRQLVGVTLVGIRWRKMQGYGMAMTMIWNVMSCGA